MSDSAQPETSEEGPALEARVARLEQLVSFLLQHMNTTNDTIEGFREIVSNSAKTQELLRVDLAALKESLGITVEQDSEHADGVETQKRRDDA